MEFSTSSRDFSTWSFYLRVKTREEGTPRHRIRRHIDLVDDHCHASCQMDFLLAIRRFEIRGLLLSNRPSSCSIDVILRVEDNTFVLVPIKCTYPHAPFRSTVTISKFSVNLRSTWETISRSREKLGEEPGTRRGQKLAREEAVNDSRYRTPRWRKRSPRVLPLTKTFLRRIVT